MTATLPHAAATPTTDAAQPAADRLDAWLDRHQAGPWRFLRLCGCPRELAEDLAQETLLAALHKHIDRLPDAAAAAWLRGAARNLWRMHLRTQRRRPRRQDLDLAELALHRHGGDDGGSAHVRALRACLQRLDGRARQALELRHAEGAGRDRIAAALGLRADGVKTLLRRTRALLQECVQRRLRAAEDGA